MKLSILNRWRDLSIAKKLYMVVGVMAVLIAGELIILRFAMKTLSAVRAIVGGEGLWSKAQKNAALHLQRYEITRDENDYANFLNALKVPEGDHLARLELKKAHPNLAIVREGFLQGGIHPDDIDPMISLLMHYHKISYLKQAIEYWTEADHLLNRFKWMANDYHLLLRARHVDQKKLMKMRADLHELNEKLTTLETEFSNVLGAGSRWLENVIITLLFLAVLTVECIGLTLTFLTSRSISKRLEKISQTANAIGEGNFQTITLPNSNDEIGRVAKSVNKMGDMLKLSYRDLNKRVAERTAELAKAVQARDDFLSVASHELKTPLTSLQLQLQTFQYRMMQDVGSSLPPESAAKLQKMLTLSNQRIKKLSNLMDTLLDVSRIQSGKLELNISEFSLSELTHEVLHLFADQLSQTGQSVTAEIENNIVGQWDRFRIEQVITNLITNAMKYGLKKTIEIKVSKTPHYALLTVRDHGIGLSPEDQKKVFQRFARCASSEHFGGFGLGLFIVKQILDLHGGSILIDSKVGEGSTFSVALPFL